jgi:hypothetical protein
MRPPVDEKRICEIARRGSSLHDCASCIDDQARALQVPGDRPERISVGARCGGERGVLGAFRGGICSRVRACRHVAGGFNEAAAARTHLVIPQQSVQGVHVWRPPDGHCGVVPVGTRVFSGTVWARHGRGLKDRDIVVSAVGHDLRYSHTVVAGTEEIGVACASFAEASEIQRTHQLLPSAAVDGIGGQYCLRRRPFADREAGLGWRDPAGSRPLWRGGLDRRSCSAGRLPDPYRQAGAASAGAAKKEDREHSSAQARARTEHCSSHRRHVIGALGVATGTDRAPCAAPKARAELG